jgi:DNA modification methylase
MRNLISTMSRTVSAKPSHHAIAAFSDGRRPSSMNTLESFKSTIEYWSTDRLIPNTRNARTHSQSQIGEIKASINQFGFTTPILSDPEGNVLAGHARLSAALSLGLETVPVIVLHHLTELQKRAYLLVDNKLALNAEWDDELLAEEIAALERDGFEIEVLGFSDEELAVLLAEDQPEDTDSDAVPAATPLEVTRSGETWLLGPHRVHCGDATSSASFDLLLAGQPADMVFTDPPYGVDYKAKGRQIVNDHPGDGFDALLNKACVNLLAVTRGALYICMSSSQLHTLHSAFTGAGGHWSTFVIWEKNHFTFGHSDYQRQYEPILYGWKEGSPHYWCGDRDQGDVWKVDKPAVNDLHPTMKPVELVKRAIHNSSRFGEIVLDAFGGAGSTLIACERTGRHARVLEIMPGYVDVMVRRWQGITGKSATLEGDGRSFEDVAADRLTKPNVADELTGVQS